MAEEAADRARALAVKRGRLARLGQAEAQPGRELRQDRPEAPARRAAVTAIPLRGAFNPAAW